MISFLKNSMIHLLTNKKGMVFLTMRSGAGFKKDNFFKWKKKIVPKNPILVKYPHTIGKFLDNF